jgi:hypothetical protein
MMSILLGFVVVFAAMLAQGRNELFSLCAIIAIETNNKHKKQIK